MSLNKTAVVTGAGSGVGRAVALALAKQDWRVALLGRRAEMLDGTIQKAGDRAAQLSAYPSDIGDIKEVEQVAKRVLADFKEVEVLVNAAGTNTPQRSLEVLSLADYHRMLDTNLNGAYYCIQAFLPGMRRRGSGTIINIISEAGRQASPKSGVAYVISKFGLTGLTQSINAEERAHGIRACAIFPPATLIPPSSISALFLPRLKRERKCFSPKMWRNAFCWLSTCLRGRSWKKYRFDLDEIAADLGFESANCSSLPNVRCMNEIIARYLKLLEQYPNNELARFSLGKAYFDIGEFAQAKEQFELALTKREDWMVAQILLGKCELALGNPEAAQQAFERARKLAIGQNHEGPLAEIEALLADLA